MRNRIGMFRALTICLGCILALGMAVTLSGCAKNKDEELVRQEISGALDKLKEPTEDNLAEFTSIGKDTFKQFEDSGVDVNEFLSHCFSNFDYTIDEVTVDGDTATANLTVTNVNLLSAVSEATYKYNNGLIESDDEQENTEATDEAEVDAAEEQADEEVEAEATEEQVDAESEGEAEAEEEQEDEEVQKAPMSVIYEVLDSSLDTKTTHPTLTLSKVDGNWVIDEASMAEFIAGMFAGLEL